MAKIKVLIVDDSALVRQLLTKVLASDAGIEVVGVAADPVIAQEKIRLLQPDVLTLDVEMPRMDGLTFLEKLMRAHPMPVLMVSSLTERGCETTLRALELGAVDVVAKPKIDIERETQEIARELVQKVKAAAMSRVRRGGAARAAAAVPEAVAPRPLAGATHKVIAVGASTGGTEALREFLGALPADSPGLVIVQHMPANFTRAFAQRLNQACRIRVAEARDGDRVLPGHALLAPGDFHMVVERSGAQVSVRLNQSPRLNHHRPAVDVLFQSCAPQLGRNAVAALFTGMGSDGAQGMLAMRRAGARTMAQDEASCVVFGMPKEAIALGAAEEVVPLHRAAEAVLRLAGGR
ncbi:MAG: chemotaxis response regulator protein-glutamate methylesterase [Bryobacterales bacterium]|nr:chemotaxis response regulator protein-glutamate methylesterase [Bryobacterales bacterium]